MPSYTRKVSVPGKSSDELYEKVSQDIEKFLSKGPSAFKFDIERDPAKKEVRLKSSMASATLHCKEGELELDAKLSLMATPFRSKIDEGIDKWISKTFNLS